MKYIQFNGHLNLLNYNMKVKEEGKKMGAYDVEKEMREAIDAGENALYSLQVARDELQKAGHWGIVEVCGGGFITNLIKHSKMDNASRLMESAKYDLRKFQKELRDVTLNTNLSIDCGDFLTFADFFWDGMIADWLVQSKINDAKRQVEDAIAQVEHILRNLRQQQ